MHVRSTTRGLAAMVLAYSIWGLFPIYWRAIGSIDTFELLQMRFLLTAAVCIALLPLRGSWNQFRESLKNPRSLRLHLLAAILLSGNWYAFIWAVSSGRILESSLGYFLAPLVSVLLGRFVEKEALGWRRGLAVLLAAVGVGLLILLAGRIPVAALVIAATWSSYGLIKKRNPRGPVVSLGLETTLLSPVAAVLLIRLIYTGQLTVPQSAPLTLALLPFAGLLTALPLLLFAYGAQRLFLATMGMGQFIVPTAHFLLAILYGEPVDRAVLAAFSIIWVGLALYSISPRRRPVVP